MNDGICLDDADSVPPLAAGEGQCFWGADSLCGKREAAHV
jgi:hypothetical protein